MVQPRQDEKVMKSKVARTFSGKTNHIWVGNLQAFWRNHWSDTIMISRALPTEEHAMRMHAPAMGSKSKRLFLLTESGSSPTQRSTICERVNDFSITVE